MPPSRSRTSAKPPAPREDADATYRRRLEGGDALLDAARIRYRQLLPLVKAFRWRQRLLDDVALLRTVAEAQPALDAALAVAQRRAAQDGWAKEAAIVACIDEVAALREALTAAVNDRLKAHAGLPLGEALTRLEQRLVTEPRLILPGERWEAALELLPPGVTELGPALALGQVCAELFATPAPASRDVLTREQLERLEVAWTTGTVALEALWNRLAAVDAAGTLVRFLRSKARSAPKRRPISGPERLLFAQYWVTTAQSRLDAWLDLAVGPVRPAPSERFEVLRWLAKKPKDPAAPLSASSTLSDGRAGLFEFAWLLSNGTARGTGDWSPLREKAHRADEARGTPDHAQLCVRLSSLAQVLRTPSRRSLPPVYRVLNGLPLVEDDAEPEASSGPLHSLEGLVGELERLSRRLTS